jgi:hypothetical protein
MPNCKETVISVVATSPDRRVVVALRTYDPLPIILKTETFSPGVGWFAQQTLMLTRAELQGLKNVLGVHLHQACELALASVEQPDSSHSSVPRILSLDAARSRRA